jgi:hypothetical protein
MRWTGLLVAGGLGLSLVLAVTLSTGERRGGAPRGEDRGAPPATSFASPSLPVGPTKRAEVPVPSTELVPIARSSQAIATEDPETERAFHARFLELARASPEALAAHAADILADDGPDPEKVALLRALSDSGSSRTSEFLLLAVERLPDAAGSGRESVPSFALRSLVGRASSEPAARLALERLAFESPARAAPELRRRSVAALCALATPEEAARIAGRLALETDASIRASGIEALTANARAGAAEVLGVLGLESAPASPSPAVEE